VQTVSLQSLLAESFQNTNNYGSQHYNLANIDMTCAKLIYIYTHTHR